MERCSDCERIKSDCKPQDQVTAHLHEESKGRIRGLSTSLDQDRMLVYPMLSPTQHFIIHSLLVPYFTQGGGGEGGRKDLQMNLPNHKKFHEFILQFLEHARRNWGHTSPYFD